MKKENVSAANGVLGSKFLLFLSMALIFCFSDLVWVRYPLITDLYSDIFVVFGVSVFMLLFVLKKEWKIALGASSVYFFIIAVYIGFAGGHLQSLSNTAAVFLLMGVFSIAITTFAKNVRRQEVIEAFAWCLFFGCLMQGVIGWGQVFHLQKIFHPFFVDYQGGVVGNISQRNNFAEYMAWGCLATCYLYARNKIKLVCLCGALLFVAYPSLASGARLELIYALSAGFLAWCYRSIASSVEGARLLKAIVIWLILLAFLSVFFDYFSHLMHAPVFETGVDRLSGGSDGRLWIWDKSWTLFLQQPWLGIGWGRFASAYLSVPSNYAQVPGDPLFTNNHNLILQLLVELGVIGCLFFVIGLIYCLLPYFKAKNLNAGNLFLIGVASFTLGHSMLEYPLWYLPFLAELVLVLALSPRVPCAYFKNRILSRALFMLVAICGFLYVLFAVFVAEEIKKDWYPSGIEWVDHQRLGQLERIRRVPFFWYESGVVMAHYLTPVPANLELGQKFLYGLTEYHPTPHLLVALMVFQKGSGQCKKFNNSFKLFNDNFSEKSLQSGIESIPGCE